MQIKKIIAELFSEEMAEYLIKNISDIDKYDIVNAICDSPVSIERKIEMHESLVGTKIDKKDEDGDYRNIFDYTFEGEKQILERIRNYIKNDGVRARKIWNCINGYSSDKKKISSVKEMEEFLKIKEKELC